MTFVDYTCKNKCNKYLCFFDRPDTVWFKTFQQPCESCSQRYCHFCNINILCYHQGCRNYMSSNCVHCFCLHQKKILQDILFDSNCNNTFKHVLVNRFKKLQRRFKKKTDSTIQAVN
jgi:hypothetical protein